MAMGPMFGWPNGLALRGLTDSARRADARSLWRRPACKRTLLAFGGHFGIIGLVLTPFGVPEGSHVLEGVRHSIPRAL